MLMRLYFQFTNRYQSLPNVVEKQSFINNKLQTVDVNLSEKLIC